MRKIYKNRGKPLTKKHSEAISKSRMGQATAIKKGDKLSKTHCRNIGLAKLGDKNPAWHGGKSIDSSGYIRILKPNYPNTNYRGYVLEHRLIMSQFLDRPLRKNEFVHHKNSNRKDNRIENLELMDRSEHCRRHMKRTNKNWIYIKGKTMVCPHCREQIKLEQITKIS